MKINTVWNNWLFHHAYYKYRTPRLFSTANDENEEIKL